MLGSCYRWLLCIVTWTFNRMIFISVWSIEKSEWVGDFFDFFPVFYFWVELFPTKILSDWEMIDFTSFLKFIETLIKRDSYQFSMQSERNHFRTGNLQMKTKLARFSVKLIRKSKEIQLSFWVPIMPQHTSHLHLKKANHWVLNSHI